jgi:hypothetical protein
MRGGRAAEVVALLIIGLGVWLGFATAGLPDVVRNSAQLVGVSADRAMADLRIISAEPHPVGTAAHDAVRDYLVARLQALGCTDVHVQYATGFNTLDGPIGGSVANVIARRPGRVPGQAILLTAHYDAVPRSPGAGDDGAGVAAILETLRALQDSPPIDHDVIVLFSDAEESGLLGAEAFADLDPMARRVGVVLNFDGRGDAGPVYMFQTSAGNAPLIDALDAGVPDARTNSLTGEVYRHLPSDTDFSIWLHSRWPVAGLNFADVGGYTHYHTPSDDIASLDPRVVQQMADYSYGMVRSLNGHDLISLRQSDAIYFNAPWLGVLRYPAAWAVPLALLAAVLTAFLLVALRSRLTAMGVVRGTTLVVLSLALPAGVVFGGWRVVSAAHQEYLEILQRDPYNSLWYLLAAAGITVAIVVELQRRFNKYSTVLELLVPALVVWVGLTIATAVALPGASYLFVIPTFMLLLGGALWTLDLDDRQMNRTMIALTTIPALVLWPPMIRALEVGLTAQMLGFCALLLALLLTSLVIPLWLSGSLRPWVGGAALAVGLAGFVLAELHAGFDADHRRPDSLFYLQDLNAGTAWWASFDRRVDPWTTLALGVAPQRRSFDTYRLSPSGGGLLSVETAVLDPVLPSPVHLLQDDSTSADRQVHLHIDHSGAGENLTLVIDDGTVTAMTLNDRPLQADNGDRYAPLYRMGSDGTVLRYFGVPAGGVDIWLTIQSKGHPTLRVTTAIDGLPPLANGSLPPRTPELMSKPFIPTDVTMTSHLLTL